jgi:hypothetical protein
MTLPIPPQIVRRIASPAGLAVAALTGLALAFYHGFWLPGLVLIERDAFRVHLPLKQHLVERLSAGELPQWFPYEALGRSFLGLSHTSLLHPFTTLYFLFPVPDAYRASTLLSCLLAALGAFVLGRTLKLSPSGALVAGISFALSGYVVSVTDNIVYLYSTCLLPLFCAALEKALIGSRPWVVAPATLWATVFLIGDIQTGYYYALLALLWTMARAPGSYREAGLRLVLAGALAALLAGIQLGPSWAVFLESERRQPAFFQEQALAWSTHPLRLATLIAGPIGESGHVTDPERYIGYFWAESLYLGVPVVGLAILGSWWRRDLHVLTLLGCLAVLFSLGRHGGLYEVFSQFMPLWSAFRYPEKFMGLVSFAAAMLAGAGLDALRNGHGRAAPWLLAAVFCAGLGAALPAEAVRNWATVSLDLPAAAVRDIVPSVAQACLFSALASTGMGIGILAIRSSTFRREFLLAIPLALIVLDLSRANLGAYHTAPAETAAFTPPLVEALRAQEGSLDPGRFRLVTLEEPRLTIPERLAQAFGHYAAVIVARRQALDALHSAEFRIESAKGYLTGYKTELAALFKLKMGPAAAARYNVRYYIGSRDRLNNPLVARAAVAELPDYDLILFRNPVPAQPRAYLSRHPERRDSPIDLAALLRRHDFLNGEADVIETADTRLPGPSQDGTARIERYAPEEVRVRVLATQPAVLILLDAYEKGWTATLESGAEIPILRANVLVRAVIVPAGAHEVTFFYETPLLKAGAWASMAGVLLCLGLIAQAQRRKRHPGDHD